MRVKDIMNQDPRVLSEDETIFNASKFMRQQKIRNLPVIDKNKKLVGLVTYREIIDSLSGNSDMILVKDAMVKQVTAVGPETPLKGAIEIMLINKFGCLPVVDNDRKLIGLITETDLLKTLYDVSTLPSDFYQFK
ncbi:MAG: CBS domain-containing protein [Candidatus Melainabacteria bacterium]|nr:CBS domain-containing protein [Candidatus Melainabacteria bacterium]